MIEIHRLISYKLDVMGQKNSVPVTGIGFLDLKPLLLMWKDSCCQDRSVQTGDMNFFQDGCRFWNRKDALRNASYKKHKRKGRYRAMNGTNCCRMKGVFIICKHLELVIFTELFILNEEPVCLPQFCSYPIIMTTSANEFTG